MQEHDNLNNNDPDLILARNFGKDLEEGRDISGRDPLLSRLMQARDSAQTKYPDLIPDSKSRVWTNIETETKASPKDNRLPLPISQAWYWAAAALVLVFFGSLFLLRQADELPVGQLSELSNQVQTISLEDGSTVTLRPFASLYRESAGESHLYRIEGEGLFDVTSNPERIFEVLAGTGRITVTGTQFKASDRNGIPSVYLLEGSVDFTSVSSGEIISLQPGMSAQLDSVGATIRISSFEPDAITSWTNNLLQFDNQTAGWVASEISYHFKENVLLPGEVAGQTLGGTIRLESLEQSLTELGLVLGGIFEQQDTGTYVFIQN